MTALRQDIFDNDGDQETPEDVVARIRARGVGQTLPPPPSQEVIERIIAHVAQQTPLSLAEQAEWDTVWDNIFAEMRRRDDDDDVAEGRRPLL